MDDGNSMDLEMEDEEDGFVEACFENGYFKEMYDRYGDVKSFLEREEKIYARSSTAADADQDEFLTFSTDLDGCVVELKSLRGINWHVRHLKLLPNGLVSVRRIFPMLKKHLPLSEYTKPQLQNLKESFGIQIFYEHGWECWLGVVPSPSRSCIELEPAVLKHLTFGFCSAVKEEFGRRLRNLCSSGQTIRKTLMKNDLLNIGTLFVLPDDCRQVLCILQESVDSCLVDNVLQPILFCFRFGEKCSEGVSMKEYIPYETRTVTVHSAVDISSPVMELLWSTAGLQSVIGSRGTLSTCATLAECGNYQSNLDGRLLDVSAVLRRVCFEPDKMRFVQFYADLPHRKPQTRFHPVSGCIAGGMTFNPRTSTAYRKDAEAYISTLETNFKLLNTSTCRLEFVTELTEFKDVVRATDCFDIKRLKDLLESKPLLVPFPCGTMTCIQEIGLWCTHELKHLLRQYDSTGNVECVWQAFQHELAVEKLLWGFPLCFKSSQYSVNLGPGKLLPSRSRTDFYGFLALDNPTACMVHEDSLPPCSIWTSSEVVAGKMTRCAGVHDILSSSSYVIGRRLVDVLIRDLNEIGRTGMRLEVLKQEMLTDKPTLAVTGCITFKQLVQLLGRGGKRLPFAMAYGDVCQLLRKANLDVADVLKEGLGSSIKHFPAIRSYDKHGNATIDWAIGMGLWKVISSGDITYQAQSSAVLSKLVTSELELRRIVYASKLKKAPVTLPWIEDCCKKLSGQKLIEEDRLKVLCFVSCIALMMNGWYVEYDGVEKLMKEIKIDQYRLRALEILSKLQLAHFNKFKLFRLHHSVPFRLKDLEVKNSQTRQEDVQNSVIEANEEEPNRISDDYETDSHVPRDVIFRAPSCLPSTSRGLGHWTPQELELLHEVWELRSPSCSKKMALYNMFREKCIKHDIPFRTFKAFEVKLNRMKQSK